MQGSTDGSVTETPRPGGDHAPEERRSPPGGAGPSWEDDPETATLRAAFLRAAVHEMMPPLSIITGMGLTLAQHPTALPPNARLELAATIARQGGRMLSTLENLLALDRLVLGDSAVSPRPTDVTDLVTEVVVALRQEPVEVLTDLAEVTAWVDPGMVERVVENLVRNAIDRQPSGDPVIVRLSHGGAGDHFMLQVFDRGPGIPPEDHEQVFRPRGPGDNRGLGLSVARAFTRMHGGEVSIVNRPEGGSVFGVTIPLRPH